MANPLDNASWTAQSYVPFTQSSLANEAALVTEVESRLRRGTLGAITTPTNTEVKRWLVRAKEELCEVFGFTWQRGYAYATATADSYRYNLPADYGGNPRLRDTSNDRKPVYLNPYQFDLKWPDMSAESSDETEAFTVKDRELWVYPPAGSTYTWELEYDRIGTDSTAATYTYIPEPLLWKMCDYATYESFCSLQQWKAAQQYKQKWMEGIIKGKRYDSRKKWSGTNYQCLNWQQEYAARHYQQ